MLIDSSNVNNGKTVNGRKAIGEFNSTKGEIVLDIGSDNVVATALHEVTHYAKINAPTQYNALRDAVLEHTTKPGKMKYYLEKYSNTYRTNNVHEITEEMTADAAEALLTNEKFIDELFNDKDFINAVVGENKGFVRKFLDTLHDIISSIKDYLKGRTVNHQIARELSEDVKALEKIEKLWRDALTAAVNNHAEISNAKENTDTQSSGGVKYSKAEKNALTKEEYKRATAAFMNGDTSAIIEDCAIRVTNKNDVYKIKIVCYNLSDDGFDFQITEVYQIENYDYNIHSENEDPAVIIAKGVRDGYTQREIEALLQNNKFDDGQIFKRFSPQSGRYYRLKKSTGRGERVSGGKSSGSGLSEETEQSETESKLKFSLSEPVEEKDNLIAVHNIYTDKLAKSLKLGGFPMPSTVVSKPDMSKVSDIDIEAYKNFSTKEAKKSIRRIAEMLGIHNVNYKNSNIKFDFAFSKGSLDTSLNHQREYGGSYTDYAEMLTCLDKLVENAELIEVHKNYKDNEYLKNTFVLISAINNDGNIAPVQLEVKEYDKGQSNSLYLNVVLSKIKKSAVVKGEHNGNTDISNPLVADSAISLSQLFANVNHTDKRFLKYVPNNFLSTEQIEAKREAQKIDYNKYGRYAEVFENVEKSGSSSKYSESAGKGNVLPDDANQSNSTDNKAVINNNDIRYSLAVDDAQAKKDGRYKKGTNYHGLGATAVKEIYEKLSNPIAVIAADNSKYISQRVIAFADLSINGKQVIAPIEVYAEISQGSDTIDANLIVSYYDKNNISNMLSKALEANNQVGFYYLDKKRAQSLLVPLGLQLPPQPNNVGSNIIIRHISSNANRKIDTVLKSRQFIRWFGGFVVLVELRIHRFHFRA